MLSKHTIYPNILNHLLLLFLLSEMEEIVGADGLKYLDKLYALITLEEEIDIDYDHIDD